MAKAKSSTGGEGLKKTRTPAEKKSAPKAPASQGAMSIDTNLAAQAAAKMLMARRQGPASASPAAPAAASSTFKQLKESLAKPHLSGMDSMLNTTAPAEGHRNNSSFAKQNQRGHNQTFSADVARSGVPRRTAG